MHLSLLLLSSFTVFVASAPVPVLPRQFSVTANDLVSGECAPVTVIFARGTSEPGNIVSFSLSLSKMCRVLCHPGTVFKTLLMSK